MHGPNDCDGGDWSHDGRPASPEGGEVVRAGQMTHQGWGSVACDLCGAEMAWSLFCRVCGQFFLIMTYAPKRRPGEENQQLCARIKTACSTGQVPKNHVLLITWQTGSGGPGQYATLVRVRLHFIQGEPIASCLFSQPILSHSGSQGMKMKELGGVYDTPRTTLVMYNMECTTAILTCSISAILQPYYSPTIYISR